MRVWLMGFGVVAVWLLLPVGVLGVFAGVPLFTGHERPVAARQVTRSLPVVAPAPGTRVVVAPPHGGGTASPVN